MDTGAFLSADGSADLTDEGLTDDELAALALAADPHAPLEPGAVPLDVYLAREPGLLPAWYMPAPAAGRGPRWRLPVVVGLVGSFLVLEALGLCTTFGHLVVG